MDQLVIDSSNFKSSHMKLSAFDSKNKPSQFMPPVLMCSSPSSPTLCPTLYEPTEIPELSIEPQLRKVNQEKTLDCSEFSKEPISNGDKSSKTMPIQVQLVPCPPVAVNLTEEACSQIGNPIEVKEPESRLSAARLLAQRKKAYQEHLRLLEKKRMADLQKRAKELNEDKITNQDIQNELKEIVGKTGEGDLMGRWFYLHELMEFREFPELSRRKRTHSYETIMADMDKTDSVYKNKLDELRELEKERSRTRCSSHFKSLKIIDFDEFAQYLIQYLGIKVEFECVSVNVAGIWIKLDILKYDEPEQYMNELYRYDVPYSYKMIREMQFQLINKLDPKKKSRRHRKRINGGWINKLNTERVGRSRKRSSDLQRSGASMQLNDIKQIQNTPTTALQETMQDIEDMRNDFALLDAQFEEMDNHRQAQVDNLLGDLF